MTTKDLEKEIALAEDLQDKLDTIEGKKPSRRKKKVTQEVASPRDAEVNADVGELDKMKQLISKNDVEQVVAPTVAYPDAVMHKNISFVKSAFRIAAGVALVLGYFQAAGALFIIAEVLGVAEELV
jgi:hypothetical protein